MAENLHPPKPNFNIGPITKYNQAKEYMDTHNIPKMFESLIASLMMEKPENHFQFLDTKLEAIKEKGIDNVDWETFVYDMHPSRDPVRQKILQTSPDETKKTKGQQPFADEVDDIMEPIQTQKDNSYKPEVFSLTEPDDDDLQSL